MTCFCQVQDDLKQGVPGAVPIPSEDAGKEEVILALVANVEAMIKADRKITALKQLQVSKCDFKRNFILLELNSGIEANINLNRVIYGELDLRTMS